MFLLLFFFFKKNTSSATSAFIPTITFGLQLVSLCEVKPSLLTCGWWCWWQTQRIHPLPAQTRAWCPCCPGTGWCCNTGGRESCHYWSSSWCGWQSSPLWNSLPSVKGIEYFKTKHASKKNKCMYFNPLSASQNSLFSLFSYFKFWIKIWGE